MIDTNLLYDMLRLAEKEVAAKHQEYLDALRKKEEIEGQLTEQSWEDDLAYREELLYGSRCLGCHVPSSFCECGGSGK